MLYANCLHCAVNFDKKKKKHNLNNNFNLLTILYSLNNLIPKRKTQKVVAQCSFTLKRFLCALLSLLICLF